MLQQTTVATILSRYPRFLQRFPDLRALAGAPEPEVLREWAGLGYYARARNLRAAARKIVAERGGVFPDDMPSLLSLPGVGSYTAAAVLSIAYGRPHAVLDGNVARVLCRIFSIRRDPRGSAARRLLQDLAQGLLDERNPGDWNQAMMELGETICVPRNPRCSDCPLRAFCAAFKGSIQDRLPMLGPRRAAGGLRWTCLWIERDGKVLIWKRGADETILKGHWGLPALGQVRARLGAVVRDVSHTITRYRITLTVRRARLLGQPPQQARWLARARLRDLLVSSLWLKAMKGLHSEAG
jgi:A/G-specific adenine glycosylase